MKSLPSSFPYFVDPLLSLFVEFMSLVEEEIGGDERKGRALQTV